MRREEEEWMFNGRQIHKKTLQIRTGTEDELKKWIKEAEKIKAF